MRLLDEAGYVEGRFRSSSTSDGAIHAAVVLRMTNAGHELLDTIRSDTVWTKIKHQSKSRGLELTFDLVMTLGKKVMEVMLGD